MRVSLLFSLLFFSLTSFASYFHARLKTTNESSQIGNHIIIAGRGLEVGDQWLRVAQTQALIYKDKVQHGPIVLISAIDDSSYLQKIKTWGYSDIVTSDSTFSAKELIQLLGQNQKIASIDFIGHNGAIVGFVLEDYQNRFFLEQAKQLATIKDHFTSNSYIRLYGCNTGWKLAPLLAETLSVPVAGSFTFSDLQDLYDNNTWYYHDAGRYPENVSAVKINSISYSQPTPCSYRGGCMRLKPVSISYQGKHGTYHMTLPFLKFFCGNLDQKSCAVRMAKSTINAISTVAVTSGKPTLQQYSQIVSDQMCSSWKDSNRRLTCYQKVQDHLSGKNLLPLSFNPIDEAMLSCNTKTCFYKTDCSSGSCVLLGTASETKSTAFTDELNLYKLGFESW